MVVLGVLLAACHPPRTDIVNTTSEDVGQFYVRSTDSGGQLVGEVCIERRQHADEIVARIIEQLKNHSYQTITLELFSGGDALGRYVWTPTSGQRRTDPEGVQNPCASQPRS